MGKKRKDKTQGTASNDQTRLTSDMEKPPGARRLVPFKLALRYAYWSKSRAYELIEQKKIAAYKDGRKTLVDLNTVDAYLNSLPSK